MKNPQVLQALGYIAGCWNSRQFPTDDMTEAAWSEVLGGYPFTLIKAAVDELAEDSPTFPPSAFDVQALLGGRAKRLLAKCADAGWTLSLNAAREGLDAAPANGATMSGEILARVVKPHKDLLVAFFLNDDRRHGVLPPAEGPIRLAPDRPSGPQAIGRLLGGAS
ncbi:MAG: hypothetical protein GY946_21990 [bacterium]|nr:hypothetical protein [bacterium]